MDNVLRPTGQQRSLNLLDALTEVTSRVSTRQTRTKKSITDGLKTAACLEYRLTRNVVFEFSK